jgi:hypothetical protein
VFLFDHDSPQPRRFISAISPLVSFLLLWGGCSHRLYSPPPPLEVEKDLTFQAISNREEGTFTMKFTYAGGSASIGIGINSQGKNKMTPANAIIGRANGDGSTSVLKYILSLDAEDASGVNSKASQTLTDVSFVQDGLTSTLTFTQLLNEPDLEVSDQSTWIYAVGLPNNQWTGKHNIRGSFQIALQSCLVVPDTPSPTDTT